jgi:hypothetical protein
MPGTPLAREHGCTCRPVDMSGWNHEFGTRPTIDVDAWCVVHGLTALIKENR